MRKELILLIFLLVWGSWIIYTVNQDIIYPGIYVEDIALGGLTLQEAQKKLQDYERKLLQENALTLYYGEEKVTVTYQEIGVTYDRISALQRAYQVGRTRDWLENYLVICSLKKKPKVFPLKISNSEENIYSLLEKMKNNFEQKPKDAIIQRNQQQFIVTEEIIGRRLNIPKTAEKIQQKVKQRQGGMLEVVLEDWVPKYIGDQLKQIQYPIGSFTTYFDSEEIMRTANIQKAAQSINGVILGPEELFSAQKSLGEITKEQGYVDAPIILNGELIPGVGGGVCQVTTTLYNAVLLSELHVVERKNHSLPVRYVPLGRDAAYATGWLDFKFKNNTQGPLYVESIVKENELQVTIYGTIQKDTTRKIELMSRIEEGENTEYLSVKLYKQVYEKDQLIEEILVNTSHYKPKPSS